MKHTTAMTKNLRQFLGAIEDLINRPLGTEGMGILWADPGEGKSTAIAYVANTYDAVFIRAMGCWTVTAMLGQVCKELGGERMGRRADMVDWIQRCLADKPRPIFIDEADYLFRQFEMLDALRDIYDLSGCPVILVGMEDFARKVQQHGRFARRITQWVEFRGIDMVDARTLSDTICDVPVADDLLRHLHSEAHANIGRMVIGLSRIEKLGRSGQPGAPITLADWGDKPFFYDQPNFARRKGGA